MACQDGFKDTQLHTLYLSYVQVCSHYYDLWLIILVHPIQGQVKDMEVSLIFLQLPFLEGHDFHRATTVTQSCRNTF